MRPKSSCRLASRSRFMPAACWPRGRWPGADKGTLFVGPFGLGNVYAITDSMAARKPSRRSSGGLNMPTGLAFKDGALYVIAVDKLIRYAYRRSQSRQDAGRQGRL